MRLIVILATLVAVCAVGPALAQSSHGPMPTMQSCDPITQEPFLKTALAGAQALALVALNTLNNTPASARPTATRYLHWFGAYNAANYAIAVKNFTAVNDALTNKTITFNCGGRRCDKDDSAYTYSWEPYVIYPCPRFWNKKPVATTNSQGGVIIHEISHFRVVADTDDVSNSVCTTSGFLGLWHTCYGQPDATALANKDPAQALRNADNYEYYAENIPFE